MKQKRDKSEYEEMIFGLIVAILILLAILILPYFFPGAAKSEEANSETATYYILCQPGDYINIRQKPSTRSTSLGRVYPGEDISTNEKTRYGFVYCPEMHTETGDGWVHSGYLVWDEPMDCQGALYEIHADGRVAARRWIDGPRRRWMKNGDQVKVWYWSQEWCVTNKGFIKTTYLEEVK